MRLPLLTRFTDQYGAPGLFAGATVIVALHQVGDLVALLQALQELGLDPSLTWFLDIPYSSHPQTKGALEGLGFLPGNFANAAALSDCVYYEGFQGARAIALFARALRQARRLRTERVLVLDDGGHSSLACRALTDTEFMARKSISVIEQTVRGMRLHERTLPLRSMRLIDVAYCEAKRRLESPIIANTILTETRSTLQRHELSVTREDFVLIIGYGTIGRGVAEALSTTPSALGSDINIVVKPSPGEDYYRVRSGRLVPAPISEFRGRVRVVFGCTGGGSFREEHTAMLTDCAALVSASSWDVEFPRAAWSCYRLPAPCDSRELPDLHATIRYRIGRKIALLVNGGYPVNFSGKLNPSPPEKMQLTPTLMAAAAVQSCRDASLGLQHLEPSTERWIISNYQDILTSRAPVQYREG